MNLKIFLSVLLVYRSNFDVLHWMVKGSKFFTLHAKASEYSEELAKDIDTIAEIILRHEDSIVNYSEALKLIEESDYKFLILESDRLFDVEEFVKISNKMFNDILHCITELLDSNDDISIKSTLENMYNKYDLQCNYLLKRLD